MVFRLGRCLSLEVDLSAKTYGLKPLQTFSSISFEASINAQKIIV
jgi:hypothetical protein